jgi:tripartite-type tricarboxylate transporter receptor subunit TctC
MQVFSKSRRGTALALAAALASGLAVPRRATAQGDAWPSRPIRLVVASGAGSGTDIFARLFAQRLGQVFGQPVVVDNRPGANGMIGNDMVAKARPDGYTLLFTYAASVVINATLQPKVPYDALKDLTPVAQIGSGGNFLVVSPQLPVHNLKEFVTYVRAHPDQLEYASWGVGSGGHLTMEALKAQTGLKIRHVPYKTVPQILTDMQGGIVKVAFVDSSSPLPLIRSGKLRALASSGTRRGPALPDLQTMTEQGYPFNADSWYGLFVPAGTPTEIVRRLNAEVNHALASPELNERFSTYNLGTPPIKTAQQFADTVRNDVRMWGEVIRAANVTPE